jgi:hypothetical protein
MEFIHRGPASCSQRRSNGTPPTPGWFAQFAGDRSEFKVMAAYFQLQKKHQAIPGSLAPDLVRSTPRPGAAAAWGPRLCRQPPVRKRERRWATISSQSPA